MLMLLNSQFLTLNLWNQQMQLARGLDDRPSGTRIGALISTIANLTHGMQHDKDTIKLRMDIKRGVARSILENRAHACFTNYWNGNLPEIQE